MARQKPTGLFLDWKFFLRLRLHLGQALAPLGLAARDFFLLSVVRERARAQRELAAIFGLDPSSMVPVVDALERQGWIERRPDPGDRRVHRITLSAAGRALHTRALRLARQMESEQMKSLNEHERAELNRLLRKLVDE